MAFAATTPRGRRDGGRTGFRSRARRCLDPSDEGLFGPLLIPPIIERALVGAVTLEAAWRLASRRFFGWARDQRACSSDYWLDLRVDDCADLDEHPPDAEFVQHATAELSEIWGCRFGRFLATLCFDQSPLAPGALHQSLWSVYDRPLRLGLELRGADLDPAAIATSTPRRRPVAEWPAPAAEDPDARVIGANAFLHDAPVRGPARVLSLFPVSTEISRPAAGVAATRLDGTSTSRPRRPRDPPLRNVHVAAAGAAPSRTIHAVPAASPRLVSTELSTSRPRRLA